MNRLSLIVATIFLIALACITSRANAAVTMGDCTPNGAPPGYHYTCQGSDGNQYSCRLVTMGTMVCISNDSAPCPAAGPQLGCY